MCQLLFGNPFLCNVHEMALEVNFGNEGRAFGGGWLHLGATLLE